MLLNDCAVIFDLKLVFNYLSLNPFWLDDDFIANTMYDEYDANYMCNS